MIKGISDKINDKITGECLNKAMRELRVKNADIKRPVTRCRIDEIKEKARLENELSL